MAPSLVIQTSFLGDTVLTTPLLAHLAQQGPVDVVTTPAARALLADNPSVRELISYDKRGRDEGVGGFLRMAKELRARRYDAVYLAQRSVRSGALARAAGIKRRVGFEGSAGRHFYTERVPYVDAVHHAARLLALGGASAPSPEQMRPRVYPSAKDVSAAEALLRPIAGHLVDRRLVALAPGSVWGTKRWPHFDDLVRRLALHHDIVLVGGKDDAAAAHDLDEAAQSLGAAVANGVGKLPLLASAALIGRAAALVTNDSLPQHLASAMGTPTITLFGPTVPDFGFGPLAPRSASAGRDGLSCRPCHHHGPQRCPLGHWRCMRELDAETVERLLTTILG